MVAGHCLLESIQQVQACYRYATSQLSQTTLRSVVGQALLDELLSERDTINQRLQAIIDQHTDPWGVKVSLVEVKFVDLPEHMKRSMARQPIGHSGRGRHERLWKS